MFARDRGNISNSPAAIAVRPLSSSVVRRPALIDDVSSAGSLITAGITTRGVAPPIIGTTMRHRIVTPTEKRDTRDAQRAIDRSALLTAAMA